MFSWRCFPFVESAPRAYRLKASNAAPLSSTSAGTFPRFAIALIIGMLIGEALPYIIMPLLIAVGVVLLVWLVGWALTKPDVLSTLAGTAVGLAVFIVVVGYVERRWIGTYCNGP